jgi:hypothetical protein
MNKGFWWLLERGSPIALTIFAACFAAVIYQVYLWRRNAQRMADDDLKQLDS